MRIGHFGTLLVVGSVAGMLGAVGVVGVGEARAEKYVLVGSWASGDILRYRQDGSLVGTFVGTGSGGLSFPDGMAYGADGNLYVSDASNGRVLRYNGTTGAYMGVFATLPGGRAGYNAFGPDGDLYVCDKNTASVHRLDPVTGASHGDLVGPGVAYPAGLAWAGGKIYVAGFQSNNVLRFDAASGGYLDTPITGVASPLYLRIGGDSRMYISEYSANRVRRWNLGTNAGAGIINGGAISGPVGQTALEDGSILVTSWNDGRILHYNEVTGAYLGQFAVGYPQANDILLTPDLVPAPGAAMVLAPGFAWVCRRRRRRA